MLEWLSSKVPYFLAFAVIATGGLDLYHRWGELKEKPLRKLSVAHDMSGSISK